MPNVKNVGTVDYSGPNALSIAVGEEVAVTEDVAAYLCGDDSPGSFERVADSAQPVKELAGGRVPGAKPSKASE